MLVRTDKKANYRAIFFNGKTIRQRLDPGVPISAPEYAEIEDVAINDRCLANCPYCYTSALKSGSNFTDVVEKANIVWGEREQNQRPFQIAIGGAGESTLHPDWVPFVKAVRGLGIVPNYTTNGMHLTEDVLKATERYCGGVAVSYHPHISRVFDNAILKLSGIDTRLNVHLIIGDEKSLKDAMSIYERYRDSVEYFVMLPYQAAGRGKALDTHGVWHKMFEWVRDLGRDSEKFAFGALFYYFLRANDTGLDIEVYEPEIYSGYRIFDDSYMLLRKSSYDLTFK